MDLWQKKNLEISLHEKTLDDLGAMIPSVTQKMFVCLSCVDRREGNECLQAPGECWGEEKQAEEDSMPDGIEGRAREQPGVAAPGGESQGPG